MGIFNRRLLPITGVSLFACAMGWFLADSARSSPPGSGAIPASLAFLAVGLRGEAVLGAMRASEGRLQELEQRLREAEAVIGNKGPEAAHS